MRRHDVGTQWVRRKTQREEGGRLSTIETKDCPRFPYGYRKKLNVYTYTHYKIFEGKSYRRVKTGIQ